MKTHRRRDGAAVRRGQPLVARGDLPPHPGGGLLRAAAARGRRCAGGRGRRRRGGRGPGLCFF